MRVVFNEGQRVPIKIWAPGGVEEGCLEQFDNLAGLPFAFHHVAGMPDTHKGYGMPIGGVLATKKVIIPNAVGVDIGCGVAAVKTNLPAEDVRPVLRDILNQIQRNIPTGFGWHTEPQESDIWAEVPCEPVVQRELLNAMRQLGTLGGGNHFIEVQSDEEGTVWVMLHSGSRNLGKQVCEYYNKIANDRNQEWFSVVKPGRELAFLPLDSDEGKDYRQAMEFCLKFAKASRAHMMAKIRDAFVRFLPSVWFEHSYDVHHNYAVMEHHFGENVMVHRKGAVKAIGTVIVPGSMGTSSYIGTGLENSESFLSCSHGAGRCMGRNEAKRQFTAQEVVEDMKALGVELFKAKKNDVAEECRQAYKDIDAVMLAQADLVKPEVRLRPLGVVKG